MKKITSVSLILISCLTIMVFIISKSNEEKNIIQGKSLDNLSTTETLVFEAKTDGFESLDELESNSKIILRGKKIGEESPVIYRS
ncbi:hypothetical protein PD280_22265 [Virgibacillus salarius]|nr:hypothetical protein [Virgibacillus salarius]WBX80262.1 hypothetical protein PD280_22265 [Virgibacillus salarius]